MKTIEMDIRGQVCPSCLLIALREVNAYHQDLIGGRLRLVVLTDNRDATGTIPEAVRNIGLFVAVDKVESYYRITVDRNND